METKQICPSCQKTLPSNVPLRLCPECLIKSGFATGTDPNNPGKDSGFVPPPIEEIARLFPHLEILELIGKGGMGAVYKARQPALDRFVALKILPPDSAKDAGFAERFNREARALARLNHPHIVAVHDFGRVGQASRLYPTSEIGPTGVASQDRQSETSETGATPVRLHYLIMEFVDGPNLRQVEQAGRLTPEHALEIVPQICEALQFAHGEGIVHRDIKPENILLDKKGRVKITDFGIAKILGKAGDLTLTGAKDVVGTPHYMAPEQMEQPTKVDHRADIFSLGVVFYEMLTGELPLGKFAPPSRKVQVDVRLDEVVLHALEKEPALRYQQASEVKTDVETIATSGRTGAPPTTAPSAAVNPWQPAILLIGALVSAALLLVSTVLPRPANWIAILFGGFGVVVAALKLAGLWPFPSGAFSGSTFTGRNLSGRRPVSRLTVPPNEHVRREVRGPAIGLVAAGILNWIAIPLIFLVTAAVASQSDSRRDYMILVPLATFVLSSVMIVAGLKMKRLEAYGLAVIGSILALLVTPGNLIGLPIGIWALVVLSHRKVRETFAKDGSLLVEASAGAAAPPVPRPDRFWRRFAVTIVLVLLALFMIPVGAIVLSIALPALRRAKVEMQSRSEPAQSSMTFGAVVERVLNDLDENRGAEALSLRAGQLLSLPADFEQRTAESREAWLNTNGVDLLVDLVRDRWALMSRGMEFRDLGNEQWSNTSTIEFGGARPGSQILEKSEGRGGTFYLLPTNAQPPMTFAFLTSSGGQGVLQIVGLLDNPHGMKMRYKLAARAGGGGGGGRTLQGDHGNDAAVLTQEGWQLWQGGRAAEAIPKFQAAVKLEPENANTWNGLGWASLNSGKTAEAQKAFRKVIELEPDHSAALNGLGQIYLAQKNYIDAESYLLKASPKASAAWYGLARLYLLQGKFEEAEKWAQKIVDSGQADETARLMLQAARDKKLSEGFRLMIEPQ